MPSGDGDFFVGLTLPPRPKPTPVPCTPVPAAPAAHARACVVSTPPGHAETRHHRVRGGARADARPGEGVSARRSGSDPKPAPLVGDGEPPPPTPPKRGCGPLSPRVSFLGLGFNEFG